MILIRPGAEDKISGLDRKISTNFSRSRNSPMSLWILIEMGLNRKEIYVIILILLIILGVLIQSNLEDKYNVTRIRYNRTQ